MAIKSNPIHKTVNDSKLWEILSFLNKRERDEFSIFIQMPSLRISKDARAFLTILIDRITKGQRVAKLELIAELKSTQKIVNYWMNQLLRALEKYLLFRDLEPETEEYEVKLMLSLQKRGLAKNTLSQQKRVEKFISDPKVKNHKHNYYNYLYYQHCLIQDSQNRSSDLYLSNFHFSLDAFFIENKLRACAESLNRKKIMQVENGDIDINFILNYAQKQQFQAYLPIKLYSWVYLMYVSDDWESYYHKIDKELKSSSNNLAPLTLKEIALFLMNQAIKAVNLGHLDYSTKYLSIVKFLISKQLLLENKILEQNRYLTIVHASLLSNKSSWLKWFVEEYTDNLASANKKAVEHLNLAQIYFFNGQYQAAENELVTIYKKNLNFKFDIYHNLSFEKLQIQICFELGKNELLSAKIISFKQWLKRQNKVHEAKKRVFLNFLDALKKIRNSKFKNDEKEVIKQLLASNIQLGSLDRKWLSKKLE